MVNATWKIVVAAQCKINPLWFTATDGYMAKASQGTQGKESQLLSWAEFTRGQNIFVITFIKSVFWYGSLFPNGSLIEVFGKFSSNVMDFSVKKKIEVLTKRSQQVRNNKEN